MGALYAFSVMKFGLPFGEDNKPEVSKVRVIGKAIKVDVLAMPKMTYQQLKKLTPGTSQKPAPKVKEEVKDTGGSDKVILNKEKKQKSLADMLSKYAKRDVKIDNKPRPTKKAQKKDVEDNTDYSGIIAAGNKLSDGTSYTGTSSEAARDAFDKYVISVMEAVRKNWKLPAYLASLELSCHVQIFLSADGKLLDYKIIKKSGNEEYDAKALSSIKAVSRFPRPNKEIANRLVAGEIVLAFPI